MSDRFVRAVALWVIFVALGACSFVARDRVLAEGQDWQLSVVAGPKLQFREGQATSGADSYTRPVTLKEASTFVTQDGGTTLVAGPVSDKATEVTVATRDGGTAQTELVVSHGLTWFWVQLPGTHEAVGIVAQDEGGAVVDEVALPPVPGDPGTPLVEPKPL